MQDQDKAQTYGVLYTAPHGNPHLITITQPIIQPLPHPTPSTRLPLRQRQPPQRLVQLRQPPQPQRLACGVIQSINYFRPIPFYETRGTISNSVYLKLCNHKIWETLSNIGNEMLVTNSGRKIFPPLRLVMYGLDPDKLYTLSLKMIPNDYHHYQYIRRRWRITGLSNAVHNECKLTVIHRESPETGLFWMEEPIDFCNVLVTDQDTDKDNMFVLHTMHKYSMRIEAERADHTSKYVFDLPNTTCIAVPEFQSPEFAQLIRDHPIADPFEPSPEKSYYVPQMAVKKRCLSFTDGACGGASVQAQGGRESSSSESEGEALANNEICKYFQKVALSSTSTEEETESESENESDNESENEADESASESENEAKPANEAGPDNESDTESEYETPEEGPLSSESNYESA